MATIGKNISDRNATFRDAFLGNKEDGLTGTGEFVGNIIADLKGDERLSAQGFSSLSSDVYLKLKYAIMNSSLDVFDKFEALDLLKSMFGEQRKYSSLLKLLTVKDSIKINLCEIINNCVEGGLLKQKDMVNIEIEMGLLLSTIQDAQMIKVKEKDMPVQSESEMDDELELAR